MRIYYIMQVCNVCISCCSSKVCGGPMADFYPTLAALVGLPPPQSAGQQINGTSLVPAFEDPEGSAKMKDAAFSQFAKPSRKNPFEFWPTPRRNETEIMGYTVRVDEWRCEPLPVPWLLLSNHQLTMGCSTHRYMLVWFRWRHADTQSRRNHWARIVCTV